ncbi:hypothetical protein [Streptomyces luteireticuli]|uniref:hypothetical protein n=1 Tax=Streptomyces luteireticuli TaxID=173858 RepID=UPI00355649FB
MTIEEYPVGKPTAPLAPHSITVGPDNYLWVTTSNNALVQIDRKNPRANTVYTDSIPTLTAGILRDPKCSDDRKIVWFASPAHEQEYDPIYEFDVAEGQIVRKHRLDNDARAQTITTVKVKSSSLDPSLPYKYYIVFAEPVHTDVGYVEVGQTGAEHRPVADADTWLWSVAVTTDPTETKYTCWATGQKRDIKPLTRTTNALYRYSTADEHPAWEEIRLPGHPDQVPIHVIAGLGEKKDDKTPYLWISARNPNRILRYNINERTWRVSPSITGEPRQLAFGPDGNIWVAGTDKIYCFPRDVSRALPSEDLPQGSEASGICLDTSEKVIWYTNPTGKKFGRYPFSALGNSSFGKTQLLIQPVKKITPGAVAEVPLVAEFVADACPTPGIPLTCRILSEEATFLDGSRECVRETDWTGQVVFPAVLAGKAEEDVLLKIGWGDNEPPTTAVLQVRDKLEDDMA